MNAKLLQLRLWYEQRDTRERLLFISLSWAIFYFLFYYSLSSNVDYQIALHSAEIAQKEADIVNVKQQIKNLAVIAHSPLYKEWQQTQTAQQGLATQHASLTQISPSLQWQKILTVILQSHPNINLIEIKNLPEVAYNPDNIKGIKQKIYAQALAMKVQSDYFDFMNYMLYLEKQLPMVHWDKLTYQVTQYPNAEIDMEFSILYEKTNT